MAVRLGVGAGRREAEVVLPGERVASGSICRRWDRDLDWDRDLNLTTGWHLWNKGREGGESGGEDL
jgi:hypothetical protein